MSNCTRFASLHAVVAATFLLIGVPAQGSALEVKGMPADAPLAVTASHDAAALHIRVELQSGWHLYGRDVGGGKPVAVRITGGAFAADGALVTPMDDKGLITGKAELRQPLRRVGNGEALNATMAFMVCDALQCLPPIELELATPAATRQDGPFPVLLVAVDAGERTQRTAAFLQARGLQPTVATYDKVTAEQCDAHALVLADSPTFDAARKATKHARAFPRTSSPVVAVGFLGTQLLEAHKVAMACGYI